MGQKYSYDYQVSEYDGDLTGFMNLLSFIRVAIQASVKQSDLLARGDDYIKNLKLAWIITNYEININRLPKIHEEVKVTTEASSYNKYFCYRNFWYHSKNGEKLAHFITTFALIDFTTRKLQTINSKIIAPYQSEKIKKIYRGPKINTPITNNQAEKSYQVRFLDIDGNFHVNNSCYVEWFIDPLGLKFLQTHTPTKLFIRYVKEVTYGNLVTSVFSIDKTFANKIKTYHQILVNNELRAEAEIHWQEINI